ncbi:hypothetical protein D9758_009125 [Tetrapyrgos nigripes]|uniref:Zn-dependent exopeptidase n=1 Tax=Tetrapyrgos nigripes TaxID=182062 RepID=A0A8H5G8P4_9AGAR|nr:hypothetical protein D9758_009125 [Tetrapyrgos nigripes]
MMPDEGKLRQSLGTKGHGDKVEIPVPTTQPTANSSKQIKKSNLRRTVLLSLVLLVGYVYLSRMGLTGGTFVQDYLGMESLLHGNSGQGHGHRHGHGHKHFLTGKAKEKVFLQVPNEDSCIEASTLYTKAPHRAGSTGDLDTAKDFLAHLQRELGIEPPSEAPIFPAGSPESQDAIWSIVRPPKWHPHPLHHGHGRQDKPRAWIDIYYPVMNTPLERNLQALDDDGNVLWEADLTEHADETDSDAGKHADAVPTFHGYSRGGDVSGKLIYANYGLKEDYDDLIEKGVNFTDAIVLVRYGGNFRGLKVKGAQELGAAGVLIYSDYRDDGAVTAENGYEIYPAGPARNPTSVQRGSVQFLSMYPGDPTTPGKPSYENATRTEGENIPKIPSLPISAANAGKLMSLLHDSDSKWNGIVRLNNQVSTGVLPIWNTMAVIPGFIKDEVVVLGNHRDAWVLGGADPSSGTASISETIRGFGELLRKGWKPLRTIVIASWDAEEYGLIGSTEWGEDFAEFVDKYVVAYLNLDSSVSGSRFSAQASPLLAHLIQKTALDIPHPTKAKEGKTLWDARQDTGEYFGNKTAQEVSIDAEVVKLYNAQFANNDDLGVGVLGSGSDFTVFLQRLGVASMNQGFGSTLNDAVYHYHSVYDTQRWQELYADPGFFRHVAVAKYLGLVALRLADPIVLPLNTTHYSFELENYLDKVESLLSDSDQSPSLKIDLTPLRNSIHSLQAASLALDYEKLVAERELVKILKAIERKQKKWRRKWRKWRKKLGKAYCRWKKVFGKECHRHHSHEHHNKFEFEMDVDPAQKNTRLPNVPDLPSGGKPRIGRLPAWIHEQKEKEEDRIAKETMHGFVLHSEVRLHHHGDCFREHQMGCDAYSGDRGEVDGDAETEGRPRLPFAKLRKAIQRVRNVNKKLIAFERGFISTNGIPAREWYKHLGVAPGKWLGYGATTLPALTESITIEKNSTLAEYEVYRLKGLVDGIVENIRV